MIRISCSRAIATPKCRSKINRLPWRHGYDTPSKHHTMKTPTMLQPHIIAAKHCQPTEELRHRAHKLSPPDYYVATITGRIAPLVATAQGLSWKISKVNATIVSSCAQHYECSEGYIATSHSFSTERTTTIDVLKRLAARFNLLPHVTKLQI